MPQSTICDQKEKIKLLINFFKQNILRSNSPNLLRWLDVMLETGRMPQSDKLPLSFQIEILKIMLAFGLHNFDFQNFNIFIHKICQKRPLQSFNVLFRLVGPNSHKSFYSHLIKELKQELDVYKYSLQSLLLTLQLDTVLELERLSDKSLTDEQASSLAQIKEIVSFRQQSERGQLTPDVAQLI